MLMILKFRFLNITPVAFPKMADELKESILIADANGIVAYFNRAFKENFSDWPLLKIDCDLKSFTDYLKSQVEINHETEVIIRSIETGIRTETVGEIMLSTSGKHFTVNIQPIYIKNDFICQIITFYDITEYKKLLSEIENKNNALEFANTQLKEYAVAAEELAVAHERNRLAGEVHDSVGHTMTVLISLIGVCSLACEKGEMNIVKQKLDEMMNAALKGHNDLRRSVLGISVDVQEPSGIIQNILSLVNDFEKTGVKVDFSVDGPESISASIHGKTIYKICREALTNSLRHGKATHVSIILRFTNGLISLYIFDDGIGCKEIKKNMGLKCMEERVRVSGGKISYGSDGEKGFNILAEIPIS